ncbi:MAG: hypothetical protein HYW95_00545 [Candidatus Wildermuthbacteria bacterium]|nr:hypothetical protein [Candidatus Wildermuthbacteria bacterium]
MHVHFIGVAGVTMAPLAVLYKKMGWKVTGSDRAFFPPMSTYLEQNGITVMPGYKEEHLNPKPDLCVVMAFITKKNPELKFAIQHKIPYKAYAEVLPQLIEGKNAIVVAGSKGKTSTTALVTWILEVAGHNPNFMIGGIAKNFPDGIRKTDSSWSVMEGDEYPVANWKKTAKFLEYHPRFLILTGITWDHMDIYPTKKSYREIFRKLVAKMPKEGAIIANAEGEYLKELLKNTTKKVLWYNEDRELHFTPPFKGKAWRENSQAAAVLAKAIGISNPIIRKALDTFQGVKRRQEVRYDEKGIVIIDDNAHSPEKVEGVLETLQEQYPQRKILAVYEPGSRNTKALNQKSYATCFAKTDYILLPRVSAARETIAHFNERLWKKFSGNYQHMEYIPSDVELIRRITKIAAHWRQSKQKGVIAFMSQKGFRGMIEETISLLRSGATPTNHPALLP